MNNNIELNSNGVNKAIQYTILSDDKMERIGIPTGLLDKNGNEILTGTKIRLGSEYEGIVLGYRVMKCFGIFLSNSLWYGNKNPYDVDCYDKVILIPKDNGMCMEIEIIREN